MKKHGKFNYQNGQHEDFMEKVWRVILYMEIYSKISQEIVRGFDGENMANQITRQSPC